MKYLPTKMFFEQPRLFNLLNDGINSIIDSSLDSYKFRTVVDEQDDAYVVTAQVPGMNKKDISIEAKDGIITIDGAKEINENMESTIHREFSIGDDVDESKAVAEVKDGILTLTLPKKEKKKAKTIKIN
ncbi:MAG: hypothetical protein CL885_00155 [Dehalococcoidia bacterium]|nr:hypothetical protein [Dehalococcoidia bacterium]|tara:strand:- start:749 stop:1135 length:387 start_codon:yes stop_codon:yes gene_type:complete